MSGIAGFEEASGAGLASALQRRQGVEGFLDVHTSTGLGVTHMAGPITPLDRTNLSSNSMQQHTKPTVNACELVSIETGQGIAVGLDITRDLQVDYVIMQVCCLPTSWLLCGQPGQSALCVSSHALMPFLSPFVGVMRDLCS